MYAIRVNYTASDSFNSEEVCEILDYGWHDIRVVKENLLRIKDHSDFCKKHGSYPGPDQLAELPACCVYHEDYNMVSVLLEMNDGTDIQYAPPWSGYMENAHSAQIILSEGPDMLVLL